MSTAIDDLTVELGRPGCRPDDAPGGAHPWFVEEPLDDAVRGAVATMDVDTMVEAIVSACATTVFSRYGLDQDFNERLRTSVRQNAYALRDVLAGDLAFDAVELADVLSFATVQARLQVPQMSMHRSYRISFFIQWELWTEHVRRHVDGLGLARHEALTSLAQLTRVLMSYQDHVASLVAETYTRDHEAFCRSRAHVRRGLVRDILQGLDAQLDGADLAILEYPLDGDHVAVILPETTEPAASRLAERMALAVHTRRTMVYPTGLRRAVVWLCRTDGWRVDSIDTLRRTLQEEGATASVSMPSPGIDGFRRAMLQAEELERVRAAWGPRDAPDVIGYADASLEILLLQDEELALAFVERELGELAAGTSEALKLRDTLEVSFGLGSHVATAECLQLHEHTVRNRLHKAEEILGHTLQERRTELLVAIRLSRLLGREAGQG